MAEFNEPKMQDVQDDSEEFELGHTDKLVGVFTSPTETYRKMAEFPPKVIDWFLPMFVFLVVVAFASFVKMSNPAISFEMKQKQAETQQKYLDEAVQKGTITREQADQQIEAAQNMMDNPVIKAIGVLVTIIGGFIVFFITAGIYHLFARFVLKGDGTYSYALVAMGLASYISIFQHIIATILSLVTSKLYMDVSLGTLIGISKLTWLGFILSLVDPISIWFYFVMGVGFAKLYKATDVKKFVIAIYSIWIGLSLFFYILATFVPFLKSFIGM